MQRLARLPLVAMTEVTGLFSMGEFYNTEFLTTRVKFLTFYEAHCRCGDIVGWRKKMVFQSRKEKASSGCDVLETSFSYVSAFSFSKISTLDEIKLIRRDICHIWYRGRCRNWWVMKIKEFWYPDPLVPKENWKSWNRLQNKKIKLYWYVGSLRSSEKLL